MMLPEKESEPMSVANSIAPTSRLEKIAPDINPGTFSMPGAMLHEFPGSQSVRRRAAAQAIEQRHHLRHGRHLHRIRADRADHEPDQNADDDQRVVKIPALRDQTGFANRASAQHQQARWNMPAAAMRLPRRAVFGELNCLMPTMNRTETPMMIRATVEFMAVSFS